MAAAQSNFDSFKSKSFSERLGRFVRESTN
jgi:hypothetical protein